MQGAQVSSSSDWFEVLAAWADDDAVKTAFATPTARTEYTGGALNGVQAGGPFVLPTNSRRCTFRIEIASTAVASAYNVTDPFIVEGTDVAGKLLSEEIKLTQAGGGETVSGVKAFQTITKITSPAHPLGTGSLRVGLGDIAFDPPVRAVKVGSATGSFLFIGPNGFASTITLLAAGDYLPLVVARVAKAQAVFPFLLLR